MNNFKKIVLALMMVIMGMPFLALAQEAVPVTEDAPVEVVSTAPKFVEWTVQQSLFMTPNEITSILQARQGLLAPEEAFDEDNQYDPIDNSTRILSLAGIVYVNRKDWTIWLNGERVTRANIPDRVISLTVKRDRVHLKWLDIREQRVVVVTLRSHQSYDLDSGLMMPGTSAR